MAGVSTPAPAITAEEFPRSLLVRPIQLDCSHRDFHGRVSAAVKVFANFRRPCGFSESETMLRLETARLELRSFQTEDAEALFELDHDPPVREFIGSNIYDHVSAYRQRIVEVYAPYADRSDGLGLWAVWEKATNRFAGWCCLRPAGDYRFAAEAGFRACDAELGYRLKSAAWGKGIATEASQGLIRDLIRRDFQGVIVATALAANHRSIRVMQKCGLNFVCEFQLPGFDQPSVSYALTKENSCRL